MAKVIKDPMDSVLANIEKQMGNKGKASTFARFGNIEALDVPFLEVSYESLVADHDTETRNVLKYLGIDKFMPLTSEFVKLNPDSLEDIIENYSEVKQTLIGTEFEKFLQ